MRAGAGRVAAKQGWAAGPAAVTGIADDDLFPVSVGTFRSFSAAGPEVQQGAGAEVATIDTDPSVALMLKASHRTKTDSSIGAVMKMK